MFAITLSRAAPRDRATTEERRKGGKQKTTEDTEDTEEKTRAIRRGRPAEQAA